MKKLSLFLSLVVLAACAGTAQQKSKSTIIAKGAEPVLLSSEFSFTEGPAADREGSIYFTDQPNNRIMKWIPGEGISLFMDNAGRSNGLYFDRDGNLISCADADNELWSIDMNKNVTVLVSDYHGKKLNGPNDLWIDPKGGIYFTDPFYKREYWTRTQKEMESENVYYLTPDRKEVRMVMNGFATPNGIIGTPDGKTLYVADLRDGKTYSFRILADGSLTDRKLFTSMGSDGMTIDEKGNVYLTGKGVFVFNSQGEQIEHIAINEPWTANVTFGGRDFKTLFITASKSVYTLKMRVKGTGRL